ncbi:MAG: DUF4383 domain-containing protein [Actinomycetota bacterium]
MGVACAAGKGHYGCHLGRARRFGGDTVEHQTWGQIFALAFGAGYLVSGFAAYAYSDGLTGGSPDDRLLFFRTNYVHAIVHVALGVGWLVAFRKAGTARSINLLFGAILLILAILGFTGMEFMHTFINAGGSVDADNFLHLGSGVAALFFGLAGTEPRGAPTA